MCGAAARQVDVDHGVDQRASQETGAAGREAALPVGLVHQVEREHRHEHAGAEGHDRRDQPLWHGQEVAGHGTDYQRRAGHRPPEACLQRAADHAFIVAWDDWRGPVAQRQSRGLLILVSWVRIPLGPPPFHA